MSEKATFGGGCFWCIEAAFEEIAGIESVTAGYAGGHTEDPSYRAVCSGNTGHAEVVQLAYDPDVVTYEELLELFFTIHDPTQLNRQGPDVGTQYRSIVLFHGDQQRALAESYIEALDEEGGYEDDVVTEVDRLDTFYRAEQKHQNYFAKHPNDAYCSMHAQPKVNKVREKFREKLKA